jgi:transglutaminase-like putative cysteine protease
MSRNKTKSIVLSIVLIIAQCFFISLYAPSVHAADYSINYNITYNVSSNGNTAVDYQIQLVNLSDSEYAASESLTLTQTDIANVDVENSFGVKQSFNVQKASNGTTIATTFSSPAIGSGSTDDWQIHYTTNQIATKEGNAWNILVPGFGDKKTFNINNLQIQVNVPSNFGPISYASPQPSQTQNLTQTTDYIFSGNNINASGINMILGSTQDYQFTFNYPVTNNNISMQSYTVAVPPDTPTQRIIFTDVSPKPDSFSVNNDGDYVLTFDLPGRKSGTIHVQGYAQVSGTYSALASKLTQPVNLPAAEQANLTSSAEYWNSNNAQVLAIATSVTKGDTTNIDKARSIYNYLVTNFKYNRNALYDPNRTRKGGLYALTHPTDVICQEYVDAFISLARAVGVPSVLEAGYGNTTSPLDTLPPNVLHAWVKFYDPNYGWVYADPTWGSTSGQNFFGNVGPSHFTLATYGYSSTTPALVLSFIQTPNEQGNIKLTPVDAITTDKVAYMLSNQNNVTMNGGFTNFANATVTNDGNRVIYLQGANLNFASKNITYSTTQSDAYIFPTMSGKLSFQSQIGGYFTSTSYSGTLTSAYTTYQNIPPLARSSHVSILVTPAWYIMVIPVIAVILIFVISYVLVNLFIKLHRKFAKVEIS